MPLTKSSSEAALRQNIAEMRNAGHPEKQAVAAAFDNQRRMKAKGMAKGGQLGIPGQGFGPQPIQAGGIHMHGLVQGAGTGRSDSIHLRVPKGSYVIPADVTSGVGKGDTIAGARALDHVFPMQARDPSKQERAHVRGFTPLMHSPFAAGFATHKLARGGHHDDEYTDIQASSGEYIVHPQAIAKRYGSLKRGQSALDHWVVSRRKAHLDEIKKIKPPVGSKQAKGQ